jgi:hypothetical protein
MLFIESRCLSSEYATPKLKYEIEMRDVVYKYKDQECGLTAQKFESSYNDGSAKEFSIVNIPTVESLTMSLSILGFENIKVVADPKTYREAVWKNKRPLNGVCIAAFLDPNKKKLVSEESNWLREYENGHERTILKEKFIKPLYNYYCLGKFETGVIFNSLLVFLYLRSPEWSANFFGSLLPIWYQEKYELEIIKNLRYSPRDKLCLEYGKILAAQKDDQNAIHILKSITTRLNADWRAVYRSFRVLAQIYRKLGLKDQEEHYMRLYYICNSKAPRE